MKTGQTIVLAKKDGPYEYEEYMHKSRGVPFIDLKYNGHQFKKVPKQFFDDYMRDLKKRQTKGLKPDEKKGSIEYYEMVFIGAKFPKEVTVAYDSKGSDLTGDNKHYYLNEHSIAVSNSLRKEDAFLIMEYDRPFKLGKEKFKVNRKLEIEKVK